MQNRIKLVLVLLLSGFFVILIKLSYWQILRQKSIKLLASNQYQTSFETTSQRGKIYASDNFPLVLNQNSYLFFADPSQLEIPSKDLLQKIDSFINKEKINPELLENKKNLWVYLNDNITEEQKEQIDQFSIKGLNFDPKEIRFYPEASMSAHLLGFVGSDQDGNSKGYFGLEGYYDKELKGKEGSYYFEKDALGKMLPIGNIKEEKNIKGRDLYLNLDRGLQFLAEKKLKQGIEKYQAVSGTITIMDPKTGAILAMASFPDFDPGNYSIFDQERFRNPVVSDIFEPGSIFKILVMASAIDSGAVLENDTCSLCAGPRTIFDYTINTWNDKYYPNSTMADIIVHSDNVGMVYVAEKLGVNRFFNYLDKFGLLQKTNIDLQGEVSSKIKPKNEWLDIDLATASFGQGIAFTPIEILTAVSAIANKGVIYQPQVVAKIQDQNKLIEIKPVKLSQPISSQTAEIIKQMMIDAVDKGEAKWAKPKGYQIAGKTGTAQIPIAGHYDPEKTIASFIGFAPAQNPSFVMLVTLNEPKTSPWGSETAAPLWFSIAQDIFRLKQIAPDY